MAKKNTVLETSPYPRREECGDCYFNGYCQRDTSKCPYLQPIVVEDEEEEEND